MWNLDTNKLATIVPDNVLNERWSHAHYLINIKKNAYNEAMSPYLPIQLYFHVVILCEMFQIWDIFQVAYNEK